MFEREFTILRAKKQVIGWEFPLTLEELAESPFAGPFDEVMMRRLDVACGSFPFAQRTHDGRRAWRIATPGRGEIDVWLTSDGGIFVEGRTSLNLVYGLLVHLMQTCPEIVLEDSITGVLHNNRSLLRLVRRDEEKRLPFSLGDNPQTTPPLAA